MGDRMRPIPFTNLLCWIREEFEKERTIFGIPETSFFSKKNGNRIRVFDESCDIPLGPAAGPHTQLTQNIVAAYLVGGRFIELKTVQKLDDLEIEKPCIDVRDEGYNTEWSQELSLEESYDEYVKAWILLHFIEDIFGLRSTTHRSFIFNMSVGYDLEGIKSPKMDRFITGLTDASGHPLFEMHLHELERFIKEGSFIKSMGLLGKARDFSAIPKRVSPHIARSVTLSTMHGCPPHEIEAISRYLMKEKELDTFVKLNPTLLGYKKVREILNTLEFSAIKMKESTFTNDLQWADAISLLMRLVEFSKECGRHFGIKLSNTLGTINTAGILPGDDMYMSGRALFPLTITLASCISREFGGNLPISYSGGVSEQNILKIFNTGIKPITLTTELLKPGGYFRMSSIARKLEKAVKDRELSTIIYVEKLDRLAKEALNDGYYRKEWRGKDRAFIDQKLPLFNCYVAPCITACPIHQDIPEYIRLVGEGQYDNALELIYLKNPLPHITGYICDHQCQYKCTRLDYEGAVSIREVKRIAAEQGNIKSRARSKALDTKVAVIGAGPTGLAASYFLARIGFEVTVFEKQEKAGGVVTHVLPHFRIPSSTIERDISFIRSQGVEFKYRIAQQFSINDLKNEGYKYIFIAIGAEASKKLVLKGDNPNISNALDFLRTFNTYSALINLGRKVAVIGGGNTAMDSARAAMRIDGVKEVSIIYRRTEEEMPADREEFENALQDGVVFSPLLIPESFSQSGILRCRRMTLGEPDESGRRRPVPTEEVQELEIDFVIGAIGESTDLEALEAGGLKLYADGRLKVNPQTLETDVENVYIGGDALRGPSTVVESIADARTAAEAIARREIPGWKGMDESFNLGVDRKKQVSEITEKRGQILYPRKEADDMLIAQNEAVRCLECNAICNKCVDVCPNRANLAIEIDGNRWQILHLDALCNECGNCDTFCPYDGKPYNDKFTLFALKEDFDDSNNDGFMITGQKEKRSVTLRMMGNNWRLGIDREGNLQTIESLYKEQIDINELREAYSIVTTILKDHSYLIS